ncbi:hypothetical protein K438DRAFT_1983707 [Mycena galopus ATCC 62051]|nr:hypothetical protein K438DRAFT_1983707 [Mycena galopus ATCC 62051]
MLVSKKSKAKSRPQKNGPSPRPPVSSSGPLLATGVPQFTLNIDPAVGPAYSEQRPVAHVATVATPENKENNEDTITRGPSADDSAPLDPDSEPGAQPSYEITATCHTTEAESKKAREHVTHLDELCQQEEIFLQALLDRQHDARVLSPCGCGVRQRLREVRCADCLQDAVVCRQCWLDRHRNMPTHWALVWNSNERFFEKTDLCRVKPEAALFLGHDGLCCPESGQNRLFTLVDSNGIHATQIRFCACPQANGIDTIPEFQQLLQAGIFPGTVKDPQTGYTLTLLEQFREHRNQDKGSLYDFLHVLQRLADPFFAGAVPDLKKFFGNIIRFHHLLDLKLRRGYAHGQDDILPGETDRAYPNRPKQYLGLLCAACPEKGVNMPLDISIPRYLRHLISQHLTLDGNFKANKFFKRDNDTDKALTDGAMYFPEQAEFDRISKSFVIAKEDKEPPCRAHIGAIRHQGSLNRRVFGGYAQRRGIRFGDPRPARALETAELAPRPAPPNDTNTALVSEALVFSYDSYCAYWINQLKRALEQFPEETWLHDLLELCEGQVAAAHINDHGPKCKSMWQPVYFGCRAHFHGESAERVWAFLNPLGASTRQMNGGARHDTINFVMDGWNTSNVLRQAKLLSAERRDAFDIFEQHLAVVKYLSQKHADVVGEWSTLSRLCTKDAEGELHSVYQHEAKKVPTIDDVLDSIMKAERELKGDKKEDSNGQPVSLWMNGGMKIERDQHLVVALLKSHKEHPLEETRAAINKLRDELNLSLKIFRERQQAFLPRVQLSAIDVDEPELTAVQLPSYLLKHGRLNATQENEELRGWEVQVRCAHADEAIERVKGAGMALSAVKIAQTMDYRGQAGVTRNSRAVQNALITKALEITMYNVARAALVSLGHIKADAEDMYPPMTDRDTSRKETHLHRPKGDSRRFDGALWYLEKGVDGRAFSGADNSSGTASTSGPIDDIVSPLVLLSGTQMVRRQGVSSPRKRKNPTPDSEASNSEESEVGGSDGEVASRSRKSPKKQGSRKSPQKKKVKKSDGWIWLERMTGREASNDEKVQKYKLESDRVQWFRAEAEMYRWREQYERKHAELMRVMTRFGRDGEVWTKRADHLEARSESMGAVTYAREQAAMCRRLEHNARLTFKDPRSRAHKDWVEATTFKDLVDRIDASREEDFKWMDEMGIHRAYKDF